MQYAFRIDGKPVALPQEVKLRRIVKPSVKSMPQELELTDRLQSFVNCAQEFEEDYVVRYVDRIVLDKVFDMMSLTVLAACCKATFLRYIRVR